MSDLFSRLFLRTLGAVSMLAVVAVVMPYSWMNAIHQWLGMGVLPDEPVVGYLARSTSAFYAMLGGLAWLVSFDLARHRLVVAYLGVTCVLLGLALLVIDWLEGLPMFLRAVEGPGDMVFGVVILWISYSAAPAQSPLS